MPTSHNQCISTVKPDPDTTLYTLKSPMQKWQKSCPLYIKSWNNLRGMMLHLLIGNLKLKGRMSE